MLEFLTVKLRKEAGGGGGRFQNSFKTPLSIIAIKLNSIIHYQLLLTFHYPYRLLFISIIHYGAPDNGPIALIARRIIDSMIRFMQIN